MEYTTEQLQDYAARLIARGKELRNALKERSRDLARFDKHQMSEAFRAEALAMHEGYIQAVLDQKNPEVTDQSESSRLQSES